jgi:hypothetical protein
MDREPLPFGVRVAMAAGILTMITAAVLIMAMFAWQPWHEDTNAGGIQGGGNPTPVPEFRKSIPMRR